MAIVLKTTYESGSVKDTKNEIYVDSIYDESYMAEMYNITVRYIRENIDSVDVAGVKRETHMAKSHDDIYYNKKDGYWIVSNERKGELSLYLRKTSVGRIYNSVYVNKVFDLKYVPCKKIIPQVFQKANKFENFQSELIDRVAMHKSRTNGKSES